MLYRHFLALVHRHLFSFFMGDGKAVCLSTIGHYGVMIKKSDRCVQEKYIWKGGGRV